jgi:hypothetical protein
MGKAEGKVQKRVFKALRELPSSYWFKLDQKVRRADPDIVGCYKGWFITVEVKAEGEEGRPLQKLRQKQIGGAGGIAVEISNDEELELFIQRMRARGEATKRRGRLQVVKGKS